MHFHISNYNNGRKLNRRGKFSTLDPTKTPVNIESFKAHISKSHVRSCHYFVPNLEPLMETQSRYPIEWHGLVKEDAYLIILLTTSATNFFNIISEILSFN